MTSYQKSLLTDGHQSTCKSALFSQICTKRKKTISKLYNVTLNTVLPAAKHNQKFRKQNDRKSFLVSCLNKETKSYKKLVAYIEIICCINKRQAENCFRILPITQSVTLRSEEKTHVWKCLEYSNIHETPSYDVVVVVAPCLLSTHLGTYTHRYVVP